VPEDVLAPVEGDGHVPAHAALFQQPDRARREGKIVRLEPDAPESRQGEASQQQRDRQADGCDPTTLTEVRSRGRPSAVRHVRDVLPTQDQQREGEERIMAAGNQRQDGRHAEDRDGFRLAPTATASQARDADGQQAEIELAR
jgi:hypothetical protein